MSKRKLTEAEWDGLLARTYTYRVPRGLAQGEADLEADAARERTVEWLQLPLLCGDGACWT